MKTSRAYALAAVSFIALSVVAAARWRSALPSSAYQTDVRSLAAAPRVVALDSTLDESLDLLVTNDLFRLANRPTAVRYDPEKENASAGLLAGPTSVPRVRPILTLKGLVGGPPWQAIIDGIPGQSQNTIVRTGATFDKLVARVVTRDSVVIQGPDTTWVLSFRRQP